MNSHINTYLVHKLEMDILLDRIEKKIHLLYPCMQHEHQYNQCGLTRPQQTNSYTFYRS